MAQTFDCGVVNVDEFPAYRGSWEAISEIIPMVLALGLTFELTGERDGRFMLRTRERS